MKMTQDPKRQAVLSAPDRSGKHTLYPVTFGVLEWLQDKRKNPLVTGGKSELKHVLELCLAFTIPSADLTAIPLNKIDGMVEAFKHELTPDEFHRIQNHAQSELVKFSNTAVTPKKARAGARTLPRKA